MELRGCNLRQPALHRAPSRCTSRNRPGDRAPCPLRREDPVHGQPQEAPPRPGYGEDFSDGLGTFTAAGSVRAGTSGARLSGSLFTDPSITSAPIDLAGHSGVTVSCSRAASGLDLGESFTAAYSVDGGSFTPLESARTATGAASFRLPASADGRDLRLRFSLDASALETLTVDDVLVEAAGGGDPDTLRNPALYIGGDEDFATANMERDYTNTDVPVWFTVLDNTDHIYATRNGRHIITAWLRWRLADEEFRRTEDFLSPGCTFCDLGEVRYKNW